MTRRSRIGRSPPSGKNAEVSEYETRVCYYVNANRRLQRYSGRMGGRLSFALANSRLVGQNQTYTVQEGDKTYRR